MKTFPVKQSGQMTLLVVSTLCLALDTVVVALRFLASRKAKRGFSRGDWTILGAWVSATFYVFSDWSHMI